MKDKSNAKPNNYFFADKLADALGSIYRAPMTVITAPPGYGTEIAVSQYMLGTDAASVWINVPKNAGREYFQNTSRRLFAEMGVLTEANVYGDPVFSPLPDCHAEINGFIHSLRRATKDSDGETALIINNFQHLPNSSDVYQFLRNIASCFVPNFRIVLLSTHYLPVAADDILSGAVKRIGKSVFCLDKEGISRFFGSYGIALTEHEKGEILDFSEGWLAALSELAMNALENGFGGAIGAIAETGRRMNEYLMEAVWGELPEIARLFLSVVSCADSFGAKQAEYMCLCAGVKIELKAILKLLEGRHILDLDEKGNYRMHGLLLSLAREEAKKLPSPVKEAAGRAVSGIETGGNLPDNPNISLLTDREWDVLPLLREGKKYGEIGKCLYISENTVKTLTQSIYRKLGINSKKELA